MNSNIVKSAIRFFLVVLLWQCSFIVQAQTANPEASSDAKKVLSFLDELKNKDSNRLLLGQDLGHGGSMVSGYTDYVQNLHNQTGKWIGMIGGDYGLDNNHDVGQTNQLLTDYWNAGGLVTVSWHFNNPWTGGDTWDTNNNENLYDLITPGNYAYDNWQAQLRQIANALRPLRDAGVVVLWRPLHEMNGDWFWYGEKTWDGHEQAYKDLYINMFDYLTYEQQMNNLLWVYSTANTYERTLTNYYPGSNYVDVVGLDIYDDNINTYHGNQDYQDLKSLGKPIGLTEFGPTLSTAYGNYDYRRLVNKIKSSFPDFVFSYSWHSWPGVSVDYASNNYASQTFADSWVITRDEINLDSDGGGGPSPVNSIEGELRIRNLWSNTYLNQNNDFQGAGISLQPLNESWYSQRWNIEAADDGSYRLRSGWASNYLTNSGDFIEAPVNAYALNSVWWSQMWLIEPVEGNKFRLKSRWTDRYLHTGDQSSVVTYDSNANWWSQIWVFEYIDGGQ